MPEPLLPADSAPAASVPSGIDALLDTLPLLAALVRADGEIVACNEPFRVHGIHKSECVPGAMLATILPMELVARLLEPSGCSDVRQATPRNGRRASSISWSARPWRGEDGLILVTGIDVSREAELEAYITENQWFETAAALSGGLAHDFNNALAGILGLSEIISLRLPTDSPLHNFTTRIASSVDRAKHLVRRFSQFSRKSTGVVDAQPTAMMLEELFQLLRAFMPSTVAISAEISSDTPWCRGDRHVLEQILLNCATFFRARLRSEGGKLHLSSRTGDTGSPVQITLTASGNGLRGIEAGRVFELDLSQSATAYDSGAAVFTARKLAEAGGCRLQLCRVDPATLVFSLEAPPAD